MSLLSLDQIKTLYDDLRGRIEDGGSVINFLPVDNASGSIASFPDGADNVPVKSLIAQITPLQAGSGDPAPDNIRPISGWTGAKINVDGVNVWDEEWDVGSISGSGEAVAGNYLRSKNYIPVIEGETYYFTKPNTTNNYRWLYAYDANKNFLPSVWGGVNPYFVLTSGSNFTVPNGVAYIRFLIDSAYGTTYNNDISINYPSTDTSYHSGTGNKTINVDWTSEGTVYGGTLTYIGGGKYSLQATHTKATATALSGSMPNYYTTVSPTPKTTNQLDILCDKMKTSSSVGADGVYINANTAIMFRTSDYATAADLLAAFGGSVDICYPLATLPDPIILDGEDVKTLLGDNNIFVDTGDVSVDYRADIALYIQKVVNA